LVDPADNVAVAIEELREGMQGTFWILDETKRSVGILGHIPVYHKFAKDSIDCGAPVIKYGERIGFAGTDIKAGQHVHIHNVTVYRGDGKPL
jgi:hypothetical protein